MNNNGNKVRLLHSGCPIFYIWFSNSMQIESKKKWLGDNQLYTEKHDEQNVKKHKSTGGMEMLFI